MADNPLPKFNELPPVDGAPKGCAWVNPGFFKIRSSLQVGRGIFDKDGVKDQLGTLNLLTPSVVLDAAAEIKTGESVALNWGLENPPRPSFREVFQHRIKDLGKDHNSDICSFDDVVTFNTQSSSQWDGLRHWGDKASFRHYNGFKHEDMELTKDLGTQLWTERGGIVGRGVLVDFQSWAERNGMEVKADTRQIITLEMIQQITAEKGVKFKVGDILIVRSGYIKAYNNRGNHAEKNALLASPTVIGSEASEEMVEWLWNSRFSAIAGDALAFESVPFPETFALHDYCLAWFGMPIGELWDLEVLAAKCKALQRWTFFLTSSPLNIQGGVGTPPNALAVF